MAIYNLLLFAIVWSFVASLLISVGIFLSIGIVSLIDKLFKKFEKEEKLNEYIDY